MKIFAFDLDKTVLNSRGKLPVENLEALNAMKNKNIILVPATGRNVNGIPIEIRKLNIRYAIVSNGSKIIDVINNDVIWSDVLSKADVTQISLELQKFKLFFSIHSNKMCYDSSLIQFFLRKILYNYSSIYFPKFNCVANEIDDICKIQILFLSKKRLIHVYERLNKLHTINVVKSSRHCLEITNKNATKGHALKILSNYLNIDRCDIISIGDNDNDVDMLRFSGTSYAVLNASDNVKTIADYITRSNDEGALKDVLI